MNRGSFSFLVVLSACASSPRSERSEWPSRPTGVCLFDWGIRAWDEERFQDARRAFEATLADASVCGAEQRQKAQHSLGKALYVLKEYESSLATFDQVAQDQQHPYHNAALKWIASLSRQLPAEKVCPSIRRYPVEELDQPALEKVRDELRNLCGVERPGVAGSSHGSAPP